MKGAQVVSQLSKSAYREAGVFLEQNPRVPEAPILLSYHLPFYFSDKLECRQVSAWARSNPLGTGQMNMDGCFPKSSTPPPGEGNCNEIWPLFL